MTAAQPDRIDRMETILEQLVTVQLQGANQITGIVQQVAEVVNLQRQQNQNIQAILDFAAGQQEIVENQQRILANHDSMISRLDAILERLVYREGRNNEPPEEERDD